MENDDLPFYSDMCNHTNNIISNDGHCNWTWDMLLCWPNTKIDSVVELPCPMILGYDPTKIVRKYCGKNGEWQRTNYTVCFTHEMLTFFQQLQNMPTEEFQMKVDIAKMVRILEIIGLTASLVVLSLSFMIYFYFRALRNERTRIHIHLFIAVIGSVLVKLVICIDQIFVGYDSIKPTSTGLDSTPFLCESAYIVLEYCKSSTYMWMFIEAFHIHSAAAVTATRLSFKKFYLILGWCVSGLLVTIWVILMAAEPRSHCWFGYNYNPLYWILEGPRVFVLIINTVFLINIIKVVFIKLRRDSSNEMEKIRKTTRATLVLLPLLGITNYLSYVEPNLSCPLWYFGVYSTVSYALNSFQGMVIGLLYCILNQEVKETVFNKIVCGFISESDSQSRERSPPENKRIAFLA